MQTCLVDASKQNIEQAARLLKAGQLVAIPTETVYGLAANALDNTAVRAIFKAKGRPQDNPLISHIASMDMMTQVVCEISPAAHQLAQQFWPGPLTMILPKAEGVADAVCAGLQTASVRMPSHPVALAVIKAAGVPLAAPSANLSGSPSPTTAQDVFADLKDRIPMILDGGSCDVGVESTVISLVQETPMLLRPGYITKEQLEQALQCEILMSDAVLHALQKDEVAASPGMKYKHYAPKAHITIVQGSFAAYQKYVKDKDAFCLCFEEDACKLQNPCVVYGSEKDANSQANRLFSALRELDARGAKYVYARCPKQEGVALAVYNRLLRAAAYRLVNLNG